VVAGSGASAGQVWGDGVERLGWISGAAKEAFWAGIDCLVVPSEWEEPAGLVAVEARARGVPVIAAAVGGLPEYVDEASRPLLFRSGDVDDLVRSMEKVLEDPNGHRPAPGTVDVTWDEHLAAVEAVYDEAMARRRG
jgi:glycosyltransferase involved in cell wall biosynthesis